MRNQQTHLNVKLFKWNINGELSSIDMARIVKELASVSLHVIEIQI